MYLNKYDCKDIIHFLEVYKDNYNDILTSEFIHSDSDCSKRVLWEIDRINELINKLR